MQSEILYISSLLIAYLVELIFNHYLPITHPIKFLQPLFLSVNRQLKPKRLLLLKVLLFSVISVASTYFVAFYLDFWLMKAHYSLVVLHHVFWLSITLSNTSTIRKGKNLFKLLHTKEELGKARKLFAQYTGSDSSKMTVNELRKAILQYIAHRLCVDLVAPVLYYMLFGLPGLLIYKTLMVIYDTVNRFKHHSSIYTLNRFIHYLIQIVPALCTSLLMILSEGGFIHLLAIINPENFKFNPSKSFPCTALSVLLKYDLSPQQSLTNLPGNLPSISMRKTALIVLRTALLTILLAATLRYLA
ncbi:cobalamin biosynthesis protein [Rapidithrix thailandica]|uniref:Cobalamin biosynthesis protein n=1 Tax=Rapidithrix thailandica TaxID=413964 RepID=A0AAW9S3G7_9BACT